MELTEANLQRLQPNQNQIGPAASFSQSSEVTPTYSITDLPRPYKFMVAGEIIHLRRYPPEGAEAIKKSGLCLRSLIEPMMKDGSATPDDPEFWKAKWEYLINTRLGILDRMGIKHSTHHDELLDPASERINAWIPPPADDPADDYISTEDATPPARKDRLYIGPGKEQRQKQYQDQEEQLHHQLGRTRKRERHDTLEAHAPVSKKRKLADCPPGREVKTQRQQEPTTKKKRPPPVMRRQPKSNRKPEAIAKSNRSSPRTITKAVRQPSPRQQGAQPVRRSARIAAQNRSK